jgi:hypothetical protein
MTIALLDKVRQTEAVLTKMVELQFRKIADHKPLDYTSPGGKLLNRVTDK